MGKIIGIDLGTTNSAFAYMVAGKPEVIANAEGNRTTPSVVAINKKGERMVGQVAQRQRVTNAKNTIYGVKRLIGRKWADKARSYTIPGGYLIPVIAIGTSLWMLAQAQTNQLLWGLGGCIVILPFYYSYWKKKKAGLIKDHDEM